MTVRAKFVVHEIKISGGSRKNPDTGKYDPCDSYTVAMSPVSDGSKENEDFFQTTPAGQITMTINNPVAGAAFKRGQAYYIDFTPTA